MFKTLSLSVLVLPLLFSVSSVNADDYEIDTEGAHAFVQFRVKHLGYSWLYGRFNDFSGEFSYDPENPKKNKISMNVDVTSLDSNHAERDKHLRAKKYLNTGKYKTASFVSTGYQVSGKDKAVVTGNLTLMGVTKTIDVDVDYIGGGPDPWGGFRQGFEGRVTLSSADFGIKAAKNVGEIELVISVEGMKKKP